jgi:long-chain acyl-CoA synthetase
MPGVPTLFNALLNHSGIRRDDLSSLRICISGGAALPHEVRRRFEEFTGCRLVEGYGLSETSPVATCNPFGGIEKKNSIGQPLPATVISIRSLDDPAREMAQGESGEICIKGPQVMPGYWNRPDETANAFTPDGWYRSGDLASIDDGGYIFIVDRAKDMVVSGGENVYTTEVENALASHPAVLEVAVFGVPHDQWGEAVHAEVSIRQGAEVTEAELIAHCRQSIGGFKVPRSIALRLEPLAKSGAGKILKREIRAPYWEGFDRSVT